MNNPLTAPIGSGAVFFGGKPAPKRKLYGELTQRMLKLDQAPMLVTYQSLQQIPGFRVVHAKESGEITSLANSNGQLFAGVSISDDRLIQWHAVHDSGLSHKSELRPYDPFQADIPGYYNWHKADLMISEGRLAGKRLWAGRRKKDDLEAIWVSGESGKPDLLAPGVFCRSRRLARRRMGGRGQDTAWKNVGRS